MEGRIAEGPDVIYILTYSCELYNTLFYSNMFLFKKHNRKNLNKTNIYVSTLLTMYIGIYRELFEYFTLSTILQ